MSDTIKLSYLLEELARDAEFERLGNALRAISPTLVGVISNVRYFHADTCPLSDCAACALFAAMKEAGVTCE